MTQPISESNREFVGSLAKGLSVIRVFGKDSPTMSVSEVARSTGITRAGARRFLLTLHSLGYLRTDGRRFSLAPCCEAPLMCGRNFGKRLSMR